MELVHLRFTDLIHSCLIGCGKENIRFYKMKNNFLPSQLVALNNTGRGKVFNNSVTAFKVDEQKQARKIHQIYVTTECGLLYMINYASR